ENSQRTPINATIGAFSATPDKERRRRETWRKIVGRGNRTGRSKASRHSAEWRRSVRRWMRGIRAFSSAEGKELLSDDERATRHLASDCE
ncbi:MAG: hypothetical protein UT41_C0008G0008, partial [Candidatus Wolfebacteria bacterium GW2011_GWC2_39_22]